MAAYKIPLPIDSIRDAAVLQALMLKADSVFAAHKDSVLLTKQGEIWRLLEWRKIEVYFKLAVRDDAAKILDSFKIGKQGEQVDHIFEVQYFAAVFLHTIAEIIVSGEVFFPEVADISFAVNLVNHGANLLSINKDFHKDKTIYFKAGNMEREISPDMLKYLKDAAPKFKNAVDKVLEQVQLAQGEHHRGFRVKLLNNLLSTPWCSADQWEKLSKETEPFSKNLTLTNYVPNEFADDNVFFNGKA